MNRASTAVENLRESFFLMQGRRVDRLTATLHSAFFGVDMLHLLAFNLITKLS